LTFPLAFLPFAATEVFLVVSFLIVVALVTLDGVPGSVLILVTFLIDGVFTEVFFAEALVVTGSFLIFFATVEGAEGVFRFLTMGASSYSSSSLMVVTFLLRAVRTWVVSALQI